jgi:hypothetical protein
MTLEQIKNRQEIINASLYSLLEDTRAVVGKIAGAQTTEKSQKHEEGFAGIGLLTEITSIQDMTEYLIQNLLECKVILVNSVYAPEEPVEVQGLR